MEKNNTYGPYGNTWADQWDNNNPDPAPQTTKKSGGDGATAKYSKKFGKSFDKTKLVASNSMKKVKDGASVGIHWIKDKYQKNTQKN